LHEADRRFLFSCFTHCRRLVGIHQALFFHGPAGPLLSGR
jgi:hypothetical protein